MTTDERPRNAVPRDRAMSLFTYVAAVVVAAVVGVAPAFADLVETVRAVPAAFWMIAALAVAVDARPVTAFGRGAAASTVFPSIAFTYALLLGWGLAPAVLVQCVAVLAVAIHQRHALWRAVFNAAQYTVCFVVADRILKLGGAGLAPPDGISMPQLAAILLAGCAWFMVNQLLVTTAIWLRFGGSWSLQLTGTLRQEAIFTLALLALSPLVMAAGNVSAALVPLMLVPLYAVREVGLFTAELQDKSLTDELTGLPNRTALFAEMNARVRVHAQKSHRLARTRRRMALLLLDINHFRRVNEVLGHEVGDRLLMVVGQRLRESIGADGFVARLGGDEFCVLAPRLTDASAAEVLAARVADALAEPVDLDGLPVDVTSAIGVAVYLDHGTDHTTLLRHAEVAMYDAKDRAATYALYSPEADRNPPDRLELLADLRRAIEMARPDEIQMHYQPQIAIATGEVVGLEALLRWHHPRRGMISPEHLIKMAEHTAVMRLLTHYVIEDVIVQLAKWRTHGLALRASINVSVRDLHDPDFVEELAAMLVDRGVPPNQIQLEITEGAFMSDPRRVLVTLHRLDRLGVALSLDDFGTGYSSLQHLRRLPLAEVKIDRSFVLGMVTDPDDAAVVRSIVDLARALGLRVVAEGVEDDITRRMLLEVGCEVAQGWYYARAVPADELLSWLARYQPVRWPPDRG